MLQRSMKAPITAPASSEGFEIVQVDALLLERRDEALGDAVALRFADVEAGVERMPSHLISAWNSFAPYRKPQSRRGPRPRAMALPKPPMWARTPWTGSSAAQRSPFFATRQPTTSESRWPAAAKNQYQPSAFVQNRDASVPQSSSGLSVRIRPLWLRSRGDAPAATAPPLRRGFRPSAAARQIPLFRSPRHSVPPLTWTPERWVN